MPFPARALSVAVVGVALAGCAGLRPLPEAEELLASSVAYHDPHGVWGVRPLSLELAESRPDGTQRETRLRIDPRTGVFTLDRREGDEVLEGRIDSESCFWNAAAGNFEMEEVQRLTCDRLQRTRDYYLYLWGLPMKLTDPGTRLGPVTRVKVDGQRLLRLRVTYDPDVGSDVWDLDFDPACFKLVGYRFFHDEAANDGEWIALEGEIEGAGMRLPRTRIWYMNDDDEHIGTDRLVALD